jgi:hypothetical protein
MSMSMWLQPPPLEEGVRSRAIELLQSRPNARFYCTLSRTSRATLAAKIAPKRVAMGHQCAFYFPPDQDFQICRLFVDAARQPRGGYVTQFQRLLLATWLSGFRPIGSLPFLG